MPRQLGHGIAHVLVVHGGVTENAQCAATSAVEEQLGSAGLVMTTGGWRPRCGRVFQDLVQALSRPHNRASMLGRCVACGYWLTHDPTCPLVLQTQIVPRARGRVDSRKAGCMPESEEARLFAFRFSLFAFPFSLQHYSLHRGGIRPHHRVRVASPLRRLLSVSVETLATLIFES
jgi:hypothetical protein